MRLLLVGVTVVAVLGWVLPRVLFAFLVGLCVVLDEGPPAW